MFNDESENLRSFDVAESGPVNSESWIDLQGNISYLGPDVLTLTIAIGPYKQDLCISCL